MSLKNKAIISGVGESEIGKVPGKSGLDLCTDAALNAINNAGLKVKDIDGMLTSYCTTEPYFVFYGALAEHMGLELDYGMTVTAGGGSAGVMIHTAAMAVATGAANNILIVAGENRASARSSAQVTQMLSAFSHPIYEDPYGVSVPAFYGMVAQRYLHDYGVTRSHLAKVAVQSRANAARTPNAHKKEPITIEDVLSSRPIVEPIHKLDCCLISDGAGAVIVSRPDQARDLAARPAYLAGVGDKFTHEHLIAAPDIVRAGSKAAADKAYAMAGLSPADVDFAELYDCFTVTPVVLSEELGLAKEGEGWDLWSDGKAGIDGAFPINTHGGMLSHCHAGAAGGLLSVVECVKQLRGTEGARQIEKHDVGIAHVEGGIMSNHSTMIFTNEPA